MKITLSLQILDIDSETVDFCMIGTEGSDSVLWEKTDEEPVGENNKLIISTDKDMRTINSIEVGSNILSSEQDIKDAFLAALFEAEIIRQVDIADGFEHTYDSPLGTSQEINPYDPKLIRVDTKPFSIEYICKLIASKKLDISPDFQREFVWTEITRQSRLIESIMLRIPIPVFYLSQDDDGRFQVVDGIQRLTVIHGFVNNKFKLKNLEYLKDLEGKWFRNESKSTVQSIPPMYSSRIEETQLFFNIIDPSTPERVKYDIFRRINTGGKTLNAQEIRNCLSNTQTRQLLKDMVNLKSFITATRGSISRTRMADKEMALRFAGFYLFDTGKITTEYKGNMDEFLDYVTNVLNKMATNNHKSIITAFDNAMKNAYLLFGDHAFRKTSFINKALFLSWSRQLYRFSPERIKDANLGNLVYNELTRKISEDSRYFNAISTATNDVQNIKKANDIAKAIMEGFLND